MYVCICMSVYTSASLQEYVALLERQLRDLRARVAACRSCLVAPQRKLANCGGGKAWRDYRQRSRYLRRLERQRRRDEKRQRKEGQERQRKEGQERLRRLEEKRQKMEELRRSSDYNAPTTTPTTTTTSTTTTSTTTTTTARPLSDSDVNLDALLADVAYR